MTHNWLEVLSVDPRVALLSHPDQALQWHIHRDLNNEQVSAVEDLWRLPDPIRLVKKQLDDGSWKYPGSTKKHETQQNYALLETYRNLQVLVEKYGFNRIHPAIQKAAAYVFSCQTAEGDIRGILGNQYMPYYHGAILEPLIKAGYEDEPEIQNGLDWLLSVRQEDGGWIVPAQAVPPKERTPGFWTGAPLPADRSLPHAHLATGMALRALAAHPSYRQRPEVTTAGEALKSRFFQADKYNDRKAPAYWLKFQFPFWWSNLLTALDTLGRLGFDREDPDIAAGLDWFVQNQGKNGLWPTGYGSGNPQKLEESERWVGLAICRVMKQFFFSSATD